MLHQVFSQPHTQTYFTDVVMTSVKWAWVWGWYFRTNLASWDKLSRQAAHFLPSYSPYDNWQEFNWIYLKYDDPRYLNIVERYCSVKRIWSIRSAFRVDSIPVNTTGTISSRCGIITWMFKPRVYGAWLILFVGRRNTWTC